jgi:hypothetical protein
VKKSKKGAAQADPPTQHISELLRTPYNADKTQWQSRSHVYVDVGLHEVPKEVPLRRLCEETRWVDV